VISSLLTTNTLAAFHRYYNTKVQLLEMGINDLSGDDSDEASFEIVLPCSADI
jgi:hypothetical protein